MDDLEATRLWKIFAAKADPHQQVMVGDLCRRAADRLPFSRWLIDCAATIQRHHPGLFDSLRSNLGKAKGYCYSWEDKSEQNSLNAINDVVKRLQQIAPELASKSVELTKEDFSRGY